MIHNEHPECVYRSCCLGDCVPADRRFAMPKPGSTTARGYGTSHQRIRASWAAAVEAGEVACARCGRLIFPGSPWHLGHTTDRSGYIGPEHEHCNTRDGAQRGNRMRALRRNARTRLEW